MDPSIDDKDLEFIEITNNTDAPISLENWQIVGETEFAFAESQTLAGGASLVILSFDPELEEEASRLTAFRAYYSMPPTVEVDFAPWPATADGTGASQIDSFFRKYGSSNGSVRKNQDAGFFRHSSSVQ